MRHSASPEIDAYPIGHGPLMRLRARARLWRHRDRFPGKWRQPFSAGMRRTSDRWKRSWQAEWLGCRTAPRAWTRAGVIRKARRWRTQQIASSLPPSMPLGHRNEAEK